VLYPCDFTVMVYSSPSKVFENGKGNTVYLLLPYKYLIRMSTKSNINNSTTVNSRLLTPA